MLKSNQNDRLFAACIKGDLEQAKALVEAGADVLYYQGDISVLGAALKSGNAELVDWLIEHGVNVRDLDIWNNNWSIDAAEGGNLELVERFLDLQRELFPGTGPLINAFYVANQNGFLDIMKYLVEQGLVIFPQESSADPSIFAYAAQLGRLDMILYLNQLNTIADLGDHFAQSSFYVHSGDSDDDTYTAPLTRAARGFTNYQESSESVLAVLVYLIERESENPDFNPQKWATNAMEYAVESRRVEVIKYMVEKLKADINHTNALGRTPLSYAATDLPDAPGKNTMEVIRYLVERGASITVEDIFDETPVHHAVRSGRLDILNYYIKQGIDIVSMAEQQNLNASHLYDSLTADLEYSELFEPNQEDDLYPDEDNSNINIDEQIALIDADPSEDDDFNNDDEFGDSEFDDDSEEEDDDDSDENFPAPFLICAAESGCLEMLKYFVEMDMMDINIRDDDGRTALLNAIYSGDSCLPNSEDSPSLLIDHGTDLTPQPSSAKSSRLEMVRYLIQHGASLDVQDIHRATPLSAAVELQDLDLIRFLVEQGADVNGHCASDLSALSLAAKAGDMDLIKFLLSKGIEIDSRDKWGRTPLFYCRELEPAEFLVELGADPFALDNQDQSMLFGFGNAELLNWFLDKGLDINQRNKDWLTPIMEAANGVDSQSEFELLLSRGAKVNDSDRDGYTPLHFVAAGRHLSMIKTLLKNGADPYAKTIDDDTAIAVAARYGQLNNVKYLCDSGLYKPEDLVSCLHNAVKGWWLPTIEYLIAFGVNVNGVNSFGDTPLHQLFEQYIDNGDYQSMSLVIAKTLIEHSADVNALNKAGEGVIHKIIQYKWTQALQLIIKLGADVNLILRYTPNKNEVNDNPQDETGRDNSNDDFPDASLASVLGDPRVLSRGVSPLYLAIHLGDLAIIKCLVEAGADVNFNSGDSILHEAVDVGNFETIKYLLDKQTLIDSKDVDGETPLFRAVRDANIDIVMYLVKKGADIHAENRFNQTPLDIARALDTTEIFDYFSSIQSDI